MQQNRKKNREREKKLNEKKKKFNEKERKERKRARIVYAREICRQLEYVLDEDLLISIFCVRNFNTLTIDGCKNLALFMVS